MALLVRALAAGLVLGVSGRIAMRLAAVLSDQPAGFSWGGSLDVVLFGVLLGVPVGCGFGYLRTRRRFGTGWGVGVSLVLFVALLLWPPPAARSALDTLQLGPFVVGGLFFGAFLVYGVALELLFRDGHLAMVGRRTGTDRDGSC